MKMRAWFAPDGLSGDFAVNRQIVGEWELAPIASEPLGFGELFMCKAAVTLPDGAKFSLIATGQAQDEETSYIFQGINKPDNIWAQSKAEGHLELRLATGRGGSLQIDIGTNGGGPQSVSNKSTDPTLTSGTSRARHEPRHR
jgi:hypothetical protein